MQPISVFLDIAKVPDFWCKNADKPQKMRHLIYMFFFSGPKQINKTF